MDFQEAFLLGKYWQYVRLSNENINVKGKGYLLDSLKDIHDYLEGAGIERGFCREVSKWMTMLQEEYSEGEKIKRKDALELRNMLNRYDFVVQKELHAIPTLKVELQSGLNPSELQKVANKEPSEFFPSKIWAKMTDIERSDLGDAARCLLTGTATPSVMVALRGAEASIRDYYKYVTKADPGKKTWRQLTQELKNKAEDLDISDTFVGYLDYIGEAKRNFAQHPNKIFSLREAVVIFMQVVGLAEDIYTQI